MKNEIKVIGKQEFMGREIQVLEGGFGENQRIITAKEIANIHNMRLADVNASINRLIEKSRIKEFVDFIDCLSETVSLRDFAKENGLIGSNRTQNVYILSERGYSKLIKSMDDDESWDVMDKLIDEYFRMREVIKSDERLKAMYLLKAVESTGEESALAIKSYSDLRIKEATTPLLETIDKQQRDIQIKDQVIKEYTPKASYYDLVLQSKGTVTITQIAKDYGMSAKQFNIKLHEMGIQYKQSGTWLLYSKYQGMGYTQSSTYVDSTGTSRLNTKWSQKGRLFIYDEMKKVGILPMIEREESDNYIEK